MSQPFLTSMKDTLLEEHNLSRTENGAFGYRTTGKELLDLNFAVSSLRWETPQEMQNRFWKAPIIWTASGPGRAGSGRFVR